MKRISLTQGQFAIVDDADFKRLSLHKWYADKTPRGFVAVRNSPTVNGKRTRIYMHRVVMDAPSDMQVDHRNHDTLYNRRENLRVCTNSQNQQNCLSHKNSFSRYKGVCWHKRGKHWLAQIKFNGKGRFLGYFTDEIDAAKAYDKEARKLFGEFALCNFPISRKNRPRKGSQ